MGRVARDAVVRTVSRGLAAFAQALALLLVARSVGPADFGMFSVAVAVGMISNAFVGMGASLRLLRLAAEPRGVQLASDLLTIRVAGSLFGFCVCCATSALGVPLLAAVAAGALTSADLLTDYVQAYFAGQRRQLASALVLLVQRLLPAIVVSVAFAMNDLSFAVFAAASVATGIVMVSVAVAHVKPSFRVRETLRSSFGYWFASVSSSASQFQPIALNFVATSSVVGNFVVATRLVSPLTIVPSTIQTIMIPEIVRDQSRADVARASKTMMRIVLAYSLLLVVLAAPIASLALSALGDAYESARAFLIAMVVASAMSAVAQAYQARLISYGRAFEAGVPLVVGVGLGLIAMTVLAVVVGESYLWVWPIFTHAIILAGLRHLANRAEAAPSLPAFALTDSK